MDNITKSDMLLSLLRRRGLTLSAAESCTGGWFSKTMVDTPGASDVFMGGVVSYVNTVKERLLGVPPSLIQQHTAVSAPVARAMAEGVRCRTQSDIGISVTGLAGPGGGSESIPVGRVYIAVSLPKKDPVVRELTLRGTREEIRRGATEAMIEFLIQLLSEQEAMIS